MNTVRCPQCNLVDWANQPVCKRCAFQFQTAEVPSALQPSNAFGETFGEQGFNGANHSNNSPQADFQAQSYQSSNQSGFNSSYQSFGQDSYQSNYQNDNQSGYRNTYQSAPRSYYEPNSKPKIKLAVISLITGIIGFPPISTLIGGIVITTLAMAIGTIGALFGIVAILAMMPVALITGIVALRRASRSPTEYGGRGFAIAGIICGSLAIPATCLIAAIAIPNLLAARRAANEGAALSAIRTLSGAEETYRATSGAGKCGDLQALANAGLIDKTLATGEKSGYRFTVTPVSCEILAKPTVTQGVSSTGNRSFYASMNEGWAIHWAKHNDNPVNANSPVLEGSQQPKPPRSDRFKDY